MRLFPVLLSLVLTPVLPALAADMDMPSREALARVQSLLSDPELRNKAINGNDASQKVDAQVKKLAKSDPQLTEQIYKLATDIFTDMVIASDGDVAQMNQLVQKGQQDPTFFYNGLSDANKKALSEIARKMEGRGSSQTGQSSQSSQGTRSVGATNSGWKK